MVLLYIKLLCPAMPLHNVLVNYGLPDGPHWKERRTRRMSSPRCNSQTSTKSRLCFISSYSLMGSATISPGLIKHEIESINAVKRLIGSKHRPFKQSQVLFNERSWCPQNAELQQTLMSHATQASFFKCPPLHVLMGVCVD